MPAHDSLIRSVREFFGVPYAIPVGSGTSGLYLTMKAIGVSGKRVIIPALTCPTVAVAVLAAGGRPLLVDVESCDCNLSTEAVAHALDGSVAAIVAVDSFGYPARMSELRDLSARHRCVLVEDACQAYGGVSGDGPLGALGHVGVISFGVGKNVELRTGGFVLTDDARMAWSIARRQWSPDFAVLGYPRRRVYRHICWGYDDLLRFLSVRTGLLRFGFAAAQITRARSAWTDFVGHLPETIADQQRIREELGTWRNITTFSYSGGSWLPWRCSFMIDDDELASHFTAVASARGLSFSRNYLPMDAYHGGLLAADDLPNARRIASRILNVPYPSSPAVSAEQLLTALRDVRRAAGM